jgi:ApbE superfamily uncharacterized protein (UPF0280 family)
MYHLVIKIEKDGKELTEIEREIDVEFVKDENGIHAVVIHPDEALVLNACNSAEDYLNTNPELWLSDVPVNDDDTDPQS